MADLGKKISELAETTDLTGLYTIGTDRNTASKKVSLQFLKEAANYANAQGDYAKGVGDTVAGNVGSTDYPVFSASGIYAIGDVVRYNNRLYRFTAPHQAGSWTGADVELTSINEESQRKLTELESVIELNQQSIKIDLSAYSKVEGSISPSKGTWTNDGYNRYHIAIPIPNGVEKISFIGNKILPTYVGIVKSYSAPVTNGVALDFSLGQKAITINANANEIITCSDDAKYLIITINSNSADATPQSVVFGIQLTKVDLVNSTSRLSSESFPFDGYVDNNGVYQMAGTTYFSTDYLPLIPNAAVRYLGGLSSSVYAIAVFDKDKNFIKSDSKLGNGGNFLIEYFNNSDDIQYVRISCRKDAFENTTISFDNIGIFKESANLNTRLESIEKQGVPNIIWEYGNINTDGTLVEPITHNRIHSSLIPILGVSKITCDATQTIGYALYDESKTFITRLVQSDSEIDVRYIALLHDSACYVSVMLRKADNSNYDLSNVTPTINIVKERELTFVPNILCLKPQTKLPVIIFNFDDCLLPGDYEVVKLFESRGVRCGFAFVTRDSDIADKAKVYLDFQKRGFDIMNHSGTVDAILTSNYSFDEAKDLIVKQGLERLQKQGFVINGFVCPSSQLSNDFLPIIAKTHAYNMIGQPYGSNSRNADVNKLSRYSLESNTKETIKAYIDECIANDKCLIFYAHTSRFGTTINNELFDINKVAEILDYCVAKRDNLECWVGGTDAGIKYYFDL